MLPQVNGAKNIQEEVDPPGVNTEARETGTESEEEDLRGQISSIQVTCLLCLTPCCQSNKVCVSVIGMRGG